MEALANTNGLILDHRNNGGGSPAGVQLLTSYFMSYEKVKRINSLYFRNRDRQIDFDVLKQLDAPRYLDKKVYVLTSDYTFSGGEECAYNFQTHELGTLIGETTGGGAHPVNRFDVGQGIFAIVPIGRAINPITKTNWEGVGVKPNISINEEKALERALEMFNK